MRPRQIRRSYRSAAIAISTLVLLASCGDDDDQAAPSSKLIDESTTTAVTPGPATSAAGDSQAPPPATDAADASDEDRTQAVRLRRQALADAALLAPDDLGDGWGDLGPAATFTMSAELAGTIPACEPFVDVVFEGNDGVWAHAGLGRLEDVVFTSVTVFATDDEAAAMVAATADPAFAPCWASFNEAAVVELPFGISAASYDSVVPPDVGLGGDSSSLLALAGTITIGSVEVPDTCVCAFVQRGRTVLALHSSAAVFTAEERHDLMVVALARIDRAFE